MTYATPHIMLNGAAPDTGNGGVTALCQSTLIGLADRGIHQFTVLDHGPGHHREQLCADRPDIHIDYLTLKSGKRWYDPKNMVQIRLRQKLGLDSAFLTHLKTVTAFLDVSGGDSFTDLYGSARFNHITLPKKIALDAGVPLVLLPQTYGPFDSPRYRNSARAIIEKASLAFARDADSFKRLKSVLGPSFDQGKHHQTVDLAFGLPAGSRQLFTATEDRDLASILNATEQGKPAGINVSGLLWHDAAKAKKTFGLKADYRATIVGLINRIVRQSDKSVLLVPHVVTHHYEEDDLSACMAVKDCLPAAIKKRVHIIGGDGTISSDPQELKAIIRQCCWFTGSRMHATIAALSTKTPVVNMAYSMKSAGVFASCNSRYYAFDLRQLGTEDMIEQLYHSYARRQDHQRILNKAVPNTLRVWNDLMDHLSDHLKGLILGGQIHA